MNQKKVFSLLLISVVMCSFLSAQKKLKIVTTIFPEYDWVRQITGTNNKDIELTLLTKNGVDMHSYLPSVQDITKISNADLFIYVGGESDSWVPNAIKNSVNKNQITINLLKLLGEKVKSEELKEGMQLEEHVPHHDHDHEDEDHHHDEDESEEEEEELDEHVWLSISNTKIICNTICNELCKIDRENSVKYKNNLKNYLKQLNDLDTEYKNTLKNSKQQTVIFGDRFPFRYLTDEYNLDYFAAFAGCSAETEASFKTVIFLANKLDELKTNSVFQIENSTGKLAKTVIQNSNSKNAKIITLNSMQSVSAKEIKKGTDYLSIMKDNLTKLKEGLNQ